MVQINWQLKKKENFGPKTFALFLWKEKGMVARQQVVIRFDRRWKLVIRRLVYKFSSKILTEQNVINPLVNWEMSQHFFLITFSEYY